MEDTRPLRAQISALLNECNYDQTRQVYEFCKQVSGRAAAARPVAQSDTVRVQKSEPEANVEIDYLCGRWMHKSGVVAQWLYDSFFQGKTEEYDDVLAMVKICYAASFPIRLIAADEKEVVGTVSIIKRDLPDKDYGPWLSYFYVMESYRNRGVASKLAARCSQILKGLGYKEAFISADKKSSVEFCESMGWQHHEAVKDNQGRKVTDVFKLMV